MTAILVVRKFDNFSRILMENGFSVINCPLIETVESENLEEVIAKISAATYDGIFLTSRAATEIAAREFFDKKNGFRGKVFVLGRSSFELLKDKDLDLFFDEKANTAREMLEAIPTEDLRQKRFLFIRGEKSLRVVPEFLKNIASLDEAIVYETRRIRITETQREEIRAKSGEIVCACFFSPSGAESFLTQIGAQVLRHTKIATIGKTTADFFAGRNLSADLISSKSTAEDFAVELAEYLKEF
jgi:uroporphyrinogen-III synthase